MDFFKMLENLKTKHTSLVLYCILDRIPIIVFGNNSEKVDKFLIELSDLVHFRKEIVFYTDFISISDYNSLIQNENIDYNSQRVNIRCPSSVSLRALNEFEDFYSWLIGFVTPNQNEDLSQIKHLIRNKLNKYLWITISSNKINLEYKGIDLKLIDLSLEETILRKISQDTEKAIIRMKRVLSDKIKSNNLDTEFVKTLLDFENEKKELKKNIFKKEIQNFYSGSKRAFFIFCRLNLLNNLEINTKIGSKTLLETIDYQEAPIERILSFINNEWGDNFSILIDNGKKVFIGDKIQSLWG